VEGGSIDGDGGGVALEGGSPKVDPLNLCNELIIRNQFVID